MGWIALFVLRDAWRPPGGALFEHRVEDGEQFAHGGGERELLRFAGGQQALVEGLQDGVVTNRRDRRHVERGTHLRPPTPQSAFAAQASAIAVERRNPHQLGDRTPSEAAEFGQLGEHRGAQHWTNPQNSTQQILALAPDGRAAQHPVEVAVTLLEPGLEPTDVGADLFVQRLAARARRLRSAVIISTSSRRRVTSALNARSCSVGKARTSGRMRSANSASIRASRASVLANCPVARAKSRTWRGFTTTTGKKIWSATESFRSARPRYLAFIAEACGKSEGPDMRLKVLAEGMTLIEDSGERMYEAELHRLKGELLLMQDAGNTEEAERCLSTAIEVAPGKAGKSLELRATVSLARLLASQGRRDEARATLHESTPGSPRASIPPI